VGKRERRGRLFSGGSQEKSYVRKIFTAWEKAKKGPFEKCRLGRSFGEVGHQQYKGGIWGGEYCVKLVESRGKGPQEEEVNQSENHYYKEVGI